MSQIPTFHIPERARFEGQQIVECAGYAYLWDGDPDLVIGDFVLAPGSSWMAPEPRVKMVTAQGTDYLGELQHIIQRIDVPRVVDPDDSQRGSHQS